MTVAMGNSQTIQGITSCVGIKEKDYFADHIHIHDHVNHHDHLNHGKLKNSWNIHCTCRFSFK